MKRRRILMVSNSLYICLPRHWCDLHGIKKGTQVDVTVNKRNQILIVPVIEQETGTDGTHIHCGGMT